jgi:hypothetical protein
MSGSLTKFMDRSAVCTEESLVANSAQPAIVTVPSRRIAFSTPPRSNRAFPVSGRDHKVAHRRLDLLEPDLQRRLHHGGIEELQHTVADCDAPDGHRPGVRRAPRNPQNGTRSRAAEWQLRFVCRLCANSAEQRRTPPTARQQRS